jgi:hypothetical protein
MAFFVLRPPLRPTRGPRLARHVLALPGSGELSIDNRRATSPGPWSNRTGGCRHDFCAPAVLIGPSRANTLPNHVVRIRGRAR